MRDIKFKIYDKELKESHIEKLQDLCEDDYWYDGETDMWSVLYDSHNEQERFVALQYTGLKDIDGREIYEGDILILKFYDCNGDIFCQEKYIVVEHTNGWQLKNTETYRKNRGLRSIPKTKYIGNIYDNP